MTNRLLYEQDVIKAVDEHTDDCGRTLDDDITCILEEIPTKDTHKKEKQCRIDVQTILHELKILNIILNQASSDIDDMFREVENDMDYNDKLNVKLVEKVVDNIYVDINTMDKYISYLRDDITNI